MAAISFEERVQQETVVRTARLPISSAQILQLNTTPLELIPAPGAGKAIEVISCYVQMTFNTTAYDTNTQLNIISSNGIMFYYPNMLAATGNVFCSLLLNFTTDSVVITENDPAKVSVQNADPLNGNSDIVIYATYRIMDL